MLDTLRANSRSVLTYLLFGIIIVVFVVSFGPGSKGCERGGMTATWAARVNGETVTPADFDLQYGQLLRIYQQQGARELDGFLQTRLRQMAMEQVVQRKLIEQESREQGVVVTDGELSAAIKALPAFQSDGRFDMDLYKRAVANVYGSPSQFEERLRRDLAYQKTLALLRGAAKVTDEEVKAAWQAENDRANLEFARFPLSSARLDVKPSEAQVKEFLAQNGSRIEQYYKEHPARFDRKKRVHARHILVKVGATAAEPEQEAAKKRIDAVAERLRKGEDFAALAKELSDDPGSKERGGDLGFFSEGTMAKPFEEAAFKLKPGETSGPVKTQFGWHLIRAEAVQEPEVVPLERAKPEIARELLESELAKKLATQKAEDALGKLKSGKSFAQALPAEKDAVKLGGQPVKVDTSGPFTAGSAPNVPRVGPAPELFADAMKLNAGEVLPRVYDTPAGPVVARVKERQRPEAAQFAQKKDEVEARLRLRRESEFEQAWLEDLRKKAKVETNTAFVQGTVQAPQVDLE